mmetsp:Transcript_10884/g.35061  ORF Transcript_10884/g.35061 Transcript_10884/m.35061 type:complete len:238 (-) Transcript_10884:541-1254(-)|eukprot:scaffold12267_cov120-Isochrysis_galbana.AAC.8
MQTSFGEVWCMTARLPWCDDPSRPLPLRPHVAHPPPNVPLGARYVFGSSRRCSQLKAYVPPRTFLRMLCHRTPYDRIASASAGASAGQTPCSRTNSSACSAVTAMEVLSLADLHEVTRPPPSARTSASADRIRATHLCVWDRAAATSASASSRPSKHSSTMRGDASSAASIFGPGGSVRAGAAVSSPSVRAPPPRSGVHSTEGAGGPAGPCSRGAAWAARAGGRAPAPNGQASGEPP